MININYNMFFNRHRNGIKAQTHSVISCRNTIRWFSFGFVTDSNNQQFILKELCCFSLNSLSFLINKTKVFLIRAADLHVVLKPKTKT